MPEADQDVPQPPIADYALLSNCRSAALVSMAGSVDWCCFGRFDSPSTFGRILDCERGGHFRVAALNACDVARRYLPGTNVLETTFSTATGEVVLTDCLHVPDDPDDPLDQLVRLVRCTSGQARVVVELRPRFDYGLTVPRIDRRSPHEALVVGGSTCLVVTSSFTLPSPEDSAVVIELELRAGDEASICVTSVPPTDPDVVASGLDQARERVAATTRWWQEWSGRCSYDGPHRDEVLRSALVLKALTYRPTGAIVAAPTTSLPESLGGVRNWDYRYVWLRDAAQIVYALFRLGYVGEAEEFMGWLCRTVAGRAVDLQPLYGVGGERLIPEHELTHLDGYHGSRPVRIGNAAAAQVQHDVYGYLADTAWLFHRHGGAIDEHLWDLLCNVVGVVAERWVDPDKGIWEVRDEPRHFVSSKVMAWVAVDRAIRLAEARDLPADLAAWKALRGEIRAQIDVLGVDEQGRFKRDFDDPSPDAANLLIPLVRYTRRDDPRVAATLHHVETELSIEGRVWRYLVDDGLPGDEATFVLCSFWLVDNLALTGDVDRAETLLGELVDAANDVGLLAEQLDADGTQLGNFPQAFSHIGLIGAAFNVVEAHRRDAGG